jgi:uncharacterized protein YbaA (DUF1428 family)
MGKYVDGFVLVVPADKADEYKKLATQGRDAWMKHGALAYYECRANDLKPQQMGDQSTRPFNEIAGAKDGEDVWFSFIVFTSKEHRDEVNAKVMADMSGMSFPDPMPTDMTRMAYGGFTVEVEG